MAGQRTEAPWDDRDPRLDPMIGPMLGNRGPAEFTLDELDAARADSSNTTETEDIGWFFDAFTSLRPRDIPSEFHYHVSETGERQACLRSDFAHLQRARTDFAVRKRGITR